MSPRKKKKDVQWKEEAGFNRVGGGEAVLGRELSGAQSKKPRNRSSEKGARGSVRFSKRRGNFVTLTSRKV